MRRHIARHENERASKIKFCHLAFLFRFLARTALLRFGCCAGLGDRRTHRGCRRLARLSFVVADATTTFSLSSGLRCSLPVRRGKGSFDWLLAALRLGVSEE